VNGFDYIRTRNSFYVPRTPRAALLSAQAGLLPIEAFVYRTLSVKPLFEEPYDPEELERVLANPALGLGDAMLLVEILTAMTTNPDKELALFAAESLGALEGRWARRVETYETEVRDIAACDEGQVYEYARALYEYALIAGRYAAIRNYYLREAYYALSKHPGACLGSEGFDLRIRCLLRLGLLDQAESILDAELGKRSDGELLVLAVEAAFLRKDQRRVRELLAGRDLGSLGLAPELEALLADWAA
jgi:hypothetical protein